MKLHRLGYGNYYRDDDAPAARVASSQPQIQTADSLLRSRIAKIVDFFRGPECGDTVTQTLVHPVEGKFRVTIEFLGAEDGE